MKKKVNLVVVGFGIVFAILSTGLIIYSWFGSGEHKKGCEIMMDAMSGH